MPTIDPKMQSDSIEMMKGGWPPAAVVQNLVQRGAAQGEAEALVEQLVRMKKEAEANAPPQGWCTRCRAPIDPRSAYLDPNGNPICGDCQNGIDVSAARQRAQVSAMERQGMPLWAINQKPHAEGEPTRTCSKCKTPTAVHVGTVHHVRNGIPNGKEYKYRCTTCGDEFTLEGWFRLIGFIVGACIAGPLGWGLLVHQILSGELLSWMSLGGLVFGLAPILAIWEVFKRIRHPVAAPARQR
jgi:hypothetical protein